VISRRFVVGVKMGQPLPARPAAAKY